MACRSRSSLLIHLCIWEGRTAFDRSKSLFSLSAAAKLASCGWNHSWSLGGGGGSNVKWQMSYSIRLVKHVRRFTPDARSTCNVANWIDKKLFWIKTYDTTNFWTKLVTGTMKSFKLLFIFSTLCLVHLFSRWGLHSLPCHVFFASLLIFVLHIHVWHLAYYKVPIRWSVLCRVSFI
jgi:hypothetical protein